MNESRFNHTAALTAGVACVLWNRLLIRTGLRRRGDGWRRGAGLILRGEAATFVLSLFGLDVWSDVGEPSSTDLDSTREHIALRLSQFMGADRSLHVCVARTPDEDRIAACNGPSYTLGFEPWVEGPARFVRPGCWEGLDCGAKKIKSSSVLFNIVCRINSDGAADVWLRFNHIGIDGAAAQEMMSGLEKLFGQSHAVIFPTPEEFAPHTGPLPCLGRDDLIEMQAFIDFGPLLSWRKRRNAELPAPMTFSAAFLWTLGQHPSFMNLTMGTTVDVPAVDGLARGVGVVVTRPADYANQPDGLARFVGDFNRNLDRSRARESDAFKTLDAAALVPPKLATRLLRHALGSDKAFGSIALTVLKDAKVFGAPMGDAGHPNGFIAIGGVGLDAGNGKKVGSLTIKGPHDRISTYPRLIQEAIRQVV